MDLKLQIISILISFIFGVYFFFTLQLVSKILVGKKDLISFLGYFIFIISSSILYFFIIKKYNYGLIHIYFFISIFTGYILSNFLDSKFIVKSKKEWYNVYTSIGRWV